MLDLQDFDLRDIEALIAQYQVDRDADNYRGWGNEQLRDFARRMDDLLARVRARGMGRRERAAIRAEASIVGHTPPPAAETAGPSAATPLPG